MMNVKDALLLTSGLLGGGSGGGGVLVNKTVTANGTYLPSADSADGYKKVVVNVPTPTPALIIKTITENGVYLPQDDGADGFDTVTVNVQGGDTEVLYGVLSRRIQTIHMDAPTIGSRAFDSCTALESAVLPKAQEIGTNAFLGCSGMQGVDIGATSIGNGAFQNSNQFNTLVLRSGTVCSVSNINAFNNTPFASGKAGGTLYVPSALIASYQAATNWSTILSYANNSIAVIEGSVYETQYVDGTPIA